MLSVPTPLPRSFFFDLAGVRARSFNNTRIDPLRQDLINHMYSETELRELADGADIQHRRISKLQTLRERLTEHFADMLPEADDA